MRLELHDIFQSGCEAGALAASPLCRIDALAADIARAAPDARGPALEIRALVADVRAGGPSREEIQEAIERVCGDDVSGICAARVADAVGRLLRGR